MKNVRNIHDKGYKKLFSNRTIFRQLLETFVNEDWVKDVDFNDCETLDKSFIDEHYKETESDLIYKLKLRGEEAYIVVLLEFQSSVERFMALRVLNYITNFYMDYLLSHKGVEKLPPVFPIVLYNGKEPWTAPSSLSQLIENHELLGRFAVSFEYLVLVEHAFPKERLLQIRNLVSTLFLTEAYYNIDLLVDEFSRLFEQEDDRDAYWLLLNWFLQLSLHGRINHEHYERIERKISTKEEVKTMLLEAVERERKAVFEKGKKEGIQKGLREGLQEGLKEGKREDARKMLVKGLAVTLIAEITGLSELEIFRLKDGVAGNAPANN